MSRYARQELFSGIGRDGQRLLRGSRVLVVGCGALGSALAETMVRAGVGALTVVDRDFVEDTNLQRQFLFAEADLGQAKAAAAAVRLRALNSDVEVRGIVQDLDPDSAPALLEGITLVLDGTDNFETRFLVNDLCLRGGVPWVYGACVSSHGLALAVRPHLSPCLRCVVTEPPAPGSSPTCDTAGIIAPAVMAVAAVQAAEALKILSGHPEALLPGLVTLDVWTGQFDVLDFAGRAPWCLACTEGRYDFLTRPPDATVLCGRDAVQIRGRGAVDLVSLAARLAGAGEVAASGHLVRFRAPGADLAVFADGRAIVKGVKDAAEARSVYARFVGN